MIRSTSLQWRLALIQGGRPLLTSSRNTQAAVQDKCAVSSPPGGLAMAAAARAADMNKVLDMFIGCEPSWAGLLARPADMKKQCPCELGIRLKRTPLSYFPC